MELGSEPMEPSSEPRELRTCADRLRAVRAGSEPKLC
jgi:hypothetical protein